MKKLVAAFAIVTVLAASAWAQGGGRAGAPTGPDPNKKNTAEEARERAMIEKDYDATMKRLRAQSAPKADPWAHMRPADSTDSKR